MAVPVEGATQWALLLAPATLMLGAFVGLALCQDEIVRSGRRVAAMVRRPQETPANRPIERIASDAGRVRATLHALDADAPMPRRIGVLRAYDDLLAEACQALAVPDSLTGLPLGVERDAERLRVEYELAEVGLRFVPPSRG